MFERSFTSQNIAWQAYAMFLKNVRNLICMTKAKKCFANIVLQGGQTVKHFVSQANFKYFANNVWLLGQASTNLKSWQCIFYFKEADIAIGSLTITSSRESAVDFSKSFMDFTMAVLYKKPIRYEENYFEFLKPFSAGIWLSIFVSVSQTIFCLLNLTFTINFLQFLKQKFKNLEFFILD